MEVSCFKSVEMQRIITLVFYPSHLPSKAEEYFVHVRPPLFPSVTTVRSHYQITIAGNFIKRKRVYHHSAVIRQIWLEWRQ